MGQFKLKIEELATKDQLVDPAKMYADSTSTLSPKVTKMMGVVKLPENFDYKKQLGDAIAKKHGRQKL